MEWFVEKGSIVRKIWGRSDTVLFIFAGAAAEFALNKAVDWLYFTGRLPADPLGRLFSTVRYSRQIIFSDKEKANQAIDRITQIHTSVEENRESKIPEWAYRDVLFMLIYYSISSFEVLDRKLSQDEKQEVFNVFHQVGIRMGLKELPETYAQWLIAREQHMQEDLVKSPYSTDLFKQYKKHLGLIRYKIFIEGQILVIPKRVNELLAFRKFSLLAPLISIYKLFKVFKGDRLLRMLIVPSAYRAQVNELDVAN
jgi:hypothetical protein